jgi:hypothetical protein
MEDTLRQLQDEVHVSPANAGSPGPRAFTGRDGWICTHQDSDFQQVRLESRDIELRVYGDAAIWWMYKMRDASIREGPLMASSASPRSGSRRPPGGDWPRCSTRRCRDRRARLARTIVTTGPRTTVDCAPANNWQDRTSQTSLTADCQAWKAT